MCYICSQKCILRINRNCESTNLTMVEAMASADFEGLTSSVGSGTIVGSAPVPVPAGGSSMCKSPGSHGGKEGCVAENPARSLASTLFQEAKKPLPQSVPFHPSNQSPTISLNHLVLPTALLRLLFLADTYQSPDANCQVSNPNPGQLMPVFFARA